jgi:uncharacterized protein YndB with AHSA1/START domain
VATTDDRALTISQVIAASPERLFDAFTKPEVMLKWWGPEGAHVGEHRFDVRVGGAWLTALENSMAGGTNTLSGVYRVIDRPRRLAFTWAWTQPDGTRGHETVVDISFEKVAAGTLMTIVQKAFVDAQQAALHGQGWDSTLRKLVRMVEQ